MRLSEVLDQREICLAERWNWVTVLEVKVWEYSFIGANSAIGLRRNPFRGPAKRPHPSNKTPQKSMCGPRKEESPSQENRN